MDLALLRDGNRNDHRKRAIHAITVKLYNHVNLPDGDAFYQVTCVFICMRTTKSGRDLPLERNSLLSKIGDKRTPVMCKLPKGLGIGRF